MSHKDLAQLAAALPTITASPTSAGLIAMICARPSAGVREVLSEGVLDASVGLVGDNWHTRGTPEKPLNPAKHLTLMNSRVIAALTDDVGRWRLAGDQLFVDLDLSFGNLPTGTRLEIASGGVLLEVTEAPHNGCAKFAERFGAEALRWVNLPENRELRLRGVYVRVVVGGRVQVGSTIAKR
jgi:MOSC domain-containing protein YiiM